MALKWEDYKHLHAPTEEDKLDKEIKEAQQQEQARKEAAHDVDWEKRYKDLEIAYSRQGQQIGEYRNLVDSFLTSTPEGDAEQVAADTPITSDDLYDNPDVAVRKVVDSHPAIKRVQELETELEKTKREAVMAAFKSKHQNYEELLQDAAFVNWVVSDPTRVELARRGDKGDMIAADALFTLYEVVNKQPEPNRTAIEDIELEDGIGGEPPAPTQYSRSEWMRQLVRAKQGDLEADGYIKANMEKYRKALSDGNVRD